MKSGLTLIAALAFSATVFANGNQTLQKSGTVQSTKLSWESILNFLQTRLRKLLIFAISLRQK